MIGAIIPCQRPIKKPAGVAPGSLYAEVDPAMERAFVFGIEGCKYKKGPPFDKIKKLLPRREARQIDALLGRNGDR